MSSPDKSLRADAQNFCDSLANVFMMKRRDPQTQRLLEKSKTLIESLLKETRPKSDRPAIPPKPARTGSNAGMGQLWVKLDELKRENDDLRRKMANKKEDKMSPGKTQGPGEVIISELHKCKTENESLRSELDRALENIKDVEKVNLTLQDEFKRTKIAGEVASDTLEKIRKERQTLESSLNSMKTENDSLKLRLTQSVKPMKRPDARLMENIQERCRPTTVAHAYSNLESQEWVDAKEALEEAGYVDDVSVMRFLAEVLMTCYAVSCELLSEVENGIAEIIKNPTKMLQTSYLASRKDQDPLPEEILSGLKESLRQNTWDVDVEPLVEKCYEKLSCEGKWNEFEGHFNNKRMHNYVTQCARVTWQMATQQTTMWLCTRDTCLDEEKHNLWWSCDKSEASVVKFFVWPALYDCENGNLLVKGMVYAEAE